MHASPFAFDESTASSTHRKTGLEYIEAYTYYFNNPNWFLNLLLTTLCYLFIPVVGPIVLLGYEYELILAKHRRTTSTYPDFDFNRFADYLMRGIWPFLVQLIQGLLILPLIVVGFAISIMLGGLSAQTHPGLAIVVFSLMLVLFFLLTVFSAVVLTPISLRAGLTRDFGQSYDLAFVKDFMSRVGWETAWATGFLFLSAPLVSLLGLLLCFVGVYPASTLILLANSHLKWQLYELYLDRGGLPIPLPEDVIVLAERA